MLRALAVAVALASALSAEACMSTAPGHAGASPGRHPGASSPASPRSPALSVTHGQAARHGPVMYRYLTDLHSGSEAARYGYNLVDLGPYPSEIDALPAGEQALVWIGNYSHSSCSFAMSDTGVRQAVGSLAGNPKVAGYYIDDEADYALPADGGHCPDVVAQVTARSQLVHQLAPGKFTYEVVSDWHNYAAFAHATDVLGADAYPCLRGHRNCNWSEIPTAIAKLRAAHVTRYWGVLQAFGGQQWRYPTPAELTRMIRQWQASDWQGEQTFAWTWAGMWLPDHPELLAVLKGLNAAGPRSSGHVPGQ